jgi:hypothetical protein
MTNTDKDDAKVDHNQDLRLGELLVQAELLVPSDLREAVRLSRAQGLTIGQVLVTSGLLSEVDLKSAIKVQSLVRDSLIPAKLAIKALAFANKEEKDIDDTLARLGWTDTGNNATNKLGELLLGAEVITLQNLEISMRISQATGVPLGQTLVSLGFLVEQLLSTALNAQILLRNKVIDRQQAVSGLRAAKQRRDQVELLLKQQGYFRGLLPSSPRLGQLLIDAEVITDTELWNSLVKTFTELKPIGQILQEGNHIDERLLLIALQIQEMVINQTLLLSQASSLLKILSKSTQSVVSALTQLEVPKDGFKTNIRFHDLLRVTGIIDNRAVDMLKLEKGTSPTSKEALQAAKTLMNNGLVDERLAHGALRCYFLLCSGWLNIQQAIIALHHFKAQGTNFDKLLQEFSWSLRTFAIENPAKSTVRTKDVPPIES